ncbi:MAG TPA: hypothetical protein VE422_36605, partial [Terriglobia bacterium]|nr:hypothetical protein [Terriglobia bacterium]
ERVAKPKGEAGKKPQEAQNAQKGARIFVLLVLFVVTSPPLQSFATSSEKEGWLRQKEKNPFRNGADGVVSTDEGFRNGFLEIPRT